MSVCAKCGEELKEGVRFCIHCGAPQEAPAEEKKKENETPVVPETEPVQEAPVEEKQAEEAPAETADTAENECAQQPAAAETVEEKPAPAFVVVTPPPPPPAAEPPKPAPVPEIGGKDKEESDKPGKKSKWGIISTWGYIGIDLLMAIPVIGFILTIIWACGGCRKYAKRNYARSKIIFFVAGIVLTIAAALVVRFAFPELIVAIYEAAHPGYTIVLP